MSAGRLITIIGAFLIGAAGVLAAMAWTHFPEPDLDAIRAEAARYDARIIRDRFGVPHIYGARDVDVGFGLGFAHAEDDWATIEESLLAARGELAVHAGRAGAQIDYVVQLLGVRDVVDAGYESDLSPEARALVEAYASGLNAWAADNPDAVRGGVLPITGRDVVAGFVLRTPFMYGLDDALGELFGPERARDIALAPITDAAPSDAPEGSNAIAVAPSRSSDGVTRLLVNSHQPFDGPVAWYEIGLHSEQGWNAHGGTFPGAPLVLHGHNERLGWAHTVNHPDLIDVYALTTDGDQYLLDGEWRPLERATARLRVRIWGPFSWTIERPIYRSAHGPVVRVSHGDYAVRYAGMTELRQVEQWYAMNRAQDWQGWRTAMEMQAIASLNAVYADADGHIAYLYNAAMPERAPGWAWRDYLPGDRSDLIWTQTHPFEDLPLYLDPPSGWLSSSNQTPFQSATDPADLLSADDFPAEFGIEPRTTNRALRAASLLGADPEISRDDLLAVKYDHVYAPTSAVGRLVERLTTLDFGDDELLRDAQTLLATWNLSADVDSEAAAIALLTARRAIGNRHTDDPWLVAPIDALRASAQDLMAHHGRLDVAWGELNRLRRGDVDLPLNGGPDTMRAVYAAGAPLGDDGRRRAVAGDTYIMLVEWDEDGDVTSHAIHQYGAATTHPDSPHYADQAPIFAAEELRRVPFTLDEVLAEATRDYRVGAHAATPDTAPE